MAKSTEIIKILRWSLGLISILAYFFSKFLPSYKGKTKRIEWISLWPFSLHVDKEESEQWTQQKG